MEARASSEGNCVAQKDEKMEAVSANIGRKRKQKRDESTQRTQRSNETIR